MGKGKPGSWVQAPDSLHRGPSWNKNLWQIMAQSIWPQSGPQSGPQGQAGHTHHVGREHAPILVREPIGDEAQHNLVQRRVGGRADLGPSERGRGWARKDQACYLMHACTGHACPGTYYFERAGQLQQICGSALCTSLCFGLERAKAHVLPATCSCSLPPRSRTTHQYARLGPRVLADAARDGAPQQAKGVAGVGQLWGHHLLPGQGAGRVGGKRRSEAGRQQSN